MDVSLQNKIDQAAKEILVAFENRLRNLKLTEEDRPLVERASTTMAEVGIYSPFVDAETVKALKVKRDGAIAVLANISVAKSINAATLFQQTAYTVISSMLRIGIEILIAA